MRGGCDWQSLGWAMLQHHHNYPQYNIHHSTTKAPPAPEPAMPRNQTLTNHQPKFPATHLDTWLVTSSTWPLSSATTRPPKPDTLLSNVGSSRCVIHISDFLPTSLICHTSSDRFTVTVFFHSRSSFHTGMSVHGGSCFVLRYFCNFLTNSSFQVIRCARFIEERFPFWVAPKKITTNRKVRRWRMSWQGTA